MIRPIEDRRTILLNRIKEKLRIQHIKGYTSQHVILWKKYMDVLANSDDLCTICGLRVIETEIVDKVEVV